MAENGFSIIWEGLQEVYEAIDKASERADEAARSIVAKGAAVVEAEIKAGFSGAHAKGQPHVGGTQPNVVTGTLRRSVRADPVVKTGPGEYSTTIGPRTVYARRVELGWHSARGYPYVTPGHGRALPKLAAIQAEEARKFLKL